MKMKPVESTQTGLAHELSCAIEKAVQNAAGITDLPAEGVDVDYREVESAAMSLLQSPKRHFTDREKSFFVLLVWYCHRQREGPFPFQVGQKAA